MMSEVWQNWGWRIQDSLEHVSGVLVVAVGWGGSFPGHVTSFSPSFSHHSLISMSSCVVRAKSEAAGPLEVRKSPSDLCCFLLHSVGQSKSQGRPSGRGRSRLHLRVGRVCRDTAKGQAEQEALLQASLGVTQQSIPARTACALILRAQI